MRGPGLRAGTRWVLAAMLLVASHATASAVDRDEYLPVDGARLFMALRGDDPRAPVLIWLHGGPGGAERILFHAYNAPLEHSFVVAYLDQRGTARSFDSDADPHTLTIARHLADLDRVIDHLLHEFAKPKVILVGHSWGSALGLLYTKQHPEKVSAFVGVGQLTSERAREQAQYAFVRSEAMRRNDKEALRRLDEIGPPPFTASRELATQQLVERFGGYWRNRPGLLSLMLTAMLNDDAMPWDLPTIFHANDVSLAAMNDELQSLDLPATVKRVDVPVVFMLGRYDHQVDSHLAAAYFGALDAPAKRLMWFEQSAHNIPFEEAQHFNEALPLLLREVGVAKGQSANDR